MDENWFYLIEQASDMSKIKFSFIIYTHRLTETAIQCLKLYFILKILIGKYVKLLVRMPWVYILMGWNQIFNSYVDWVTIDEAIMSVRCGNSEV